MEIPFSSELFVSAKCVLCMFCPGCPREGLRGSFQTSYKMWKRLYPFLVQRNQMAASGFNQHPKVMPDGTRWTVPLLHATPNTFPLQIKLRSVQRTQDHCRNSGLSSFSLQKRGVPNFTNTVNSSDMFTNLDEGADLISA